MADNLFNLLPAEVMSLIFQKLKLKTKLRCRLVYFHWKTVMDRLLKVKILLTNDTMDMNCQLEVEVLKIKNFTKEFPKGALTRSRGGLAKSPSIIEFMRIRTENLSGISLSPQNMVNILRLNRTTQHICLSFNTLLHAPSSFGRLKGCPFDHLTHIVLCFNSDPSERENIEHLSKLRMPVLSHLALIGRFQPHIFENSEVYVMAYEFASRHKSTLKILNIAHPICCNLVKPTDPPLDPNKYEKIKEDLSEIQLDAMFVKFDKNEGKYEYFLALKLLQNQHFLDTLQLNFRENYQVTSANIGQVLSQNARTLTSLDFIANRRLTDRVATGNKFDSLSLCSRLEFLKIVNFSIQLPPHLPTSIRLLLLWGEFTDPQNTLTQVRLSLPQLEQFEYYDLRTSVQLNDHQIEEDELLGEQLKMLVKMPKLHTIHFFKPEFNISDVGLDSEVGVKVFCCNFMSAWSWPLKMDTLRLGSKITIDHSANRAN